MDRISDEEYREAFKRDEMVINRLIKDCQRLSARTQKLMALSTIFGLVAIIMVFACGVLAGQVSQLRHSVKVECKLVRP